MGHKQNNRAEGEGKERPLERQIQVVEKLVEKLTGMLEGSGRCGRRWRSWRR